MVISMRKRFLSVPQNTEGIEEYNIGIEESGNLYFDELPEKEFVELIPCFSKINKEFGLLIDDYESEIIKKEHLSKCKKIINEAKADVPVFLKSLDMAMKCETMLALDF